MSSVHRMPNLWIIEFAVTKSLDDESAYYRHRLPHSSTTLYRHPQWPILWLTRTPAPAMYTTPHTNGGWSVLDAELSTIVTKAQFPRYNK